MMGYIPSVLVYVLREGKVLLMHRSSHPQADAIFAPKILAMSKGCFQAKFVYDAHLNLVEWIEY